MEFESCPIVCGNDEAEICGAFCDACPVKEAEDNFRDYSISALENNPKLKGKWQQWGFDSLKQAVGEIADLEDLPRAERSVKTHRLIQALQSARNRFERIERQNSKPTE